MIITLLSALCITPMVAQEESEEDLLSLAALMIKDGYYDRAENILQSVDLNDDELDKVRFYTLSGLVYMKKRVYIKAIENFENAIKEGQTDKSVYLYIAQAYFELKDYANALVNFKNAGDVAYSKPAIISVIAECEWKTQKQDDAIMTLKEGLKRFPQHNAFDKQLFYYFVELGLFQEASIYAQRYLKNKDIDAQSYIQIANIFEKANEPKHSREILEEAHLRFPGNVKVTIYLAHIYIKLGMLHTAADLFDQASLEDAKYIAEASEMYRRAKELYRALYLNSQIIDQQEKYKQRMAILLEFGDYEKAAAMEEALERVQLIEDENIRYALAFTLFQIGRYDECEAHLKQITTPELFRKSIQIRKSIEMCNEKPWECH